VSTAFPVTFFLCTRKIGQIKLGRWIDPFVKSSIYFWFQCTVDDLQKAFTPFGTVTEVDIPKKPNGKKFGFGIVQLSNVADAATAVTAMNSKEIRGTLLIH